MLQIRLCEDPNADTGAEKPVIGCIQEKERDAPDRGKPISKITKAKTHTARFHSRVSKSQNPKFLTTSSISHSDSKHLHATFFFSSINQDAGPAGSFPKSAADELIAGRCVGPLWSQQYLRGDPWTSHVTERPDPNSIWL